MVFPQSRSNYRNGSPILSCYPTFLMQVFRLEAILPNHETMFLSYIFFVTNQEISIKDQYFKEVTMIMSSVNLLTKRCIFRPPKTECPSLPRGFPSIYSATTSYIYFYRCLFLSSDFSIYSGFKSLRACNHYCSTEHDDRVKAQCI
jgi:hypothetical protein